MVFKKHTWIINLESLEGKLHMSGKRDTLALICFSFNHPFSLNLRCSEFLWSHFGRFHNKSMEKKFPFKKFPFEKSARHLNENLCRIIF